MGNCSRRFKNLDKRFTLDAACDSNNNVVGPFEVAQARFLGSQVIPIVSGWFGEINEDVDKVIKLVAWQAAAGEDGMATSPLVNTDRKGGSYLIMLQQFRRAI